MSHTMPAIAVEDITQFLNDEAYHHACRALSKHRFLELNQDAGTLTVGTGTGCRLLIQLMPGGTVITKSDRKRPGGRLNRTQRVERVPLRASSNNYFAGAWYDILAQASAILWERIEAFVGLDEYEVLPQDHPHRVHRAVRNVLALPEVTSAVNRCAQAVRAGNGHGYVGNPTTLAYGLLHQLLGRDQVSRVLRAAGAHATLEEWNTFFLHQDALQAVSDTLPNASVLWFAASQGKKPDQDLTPETIIRDARHAFTQQCGQEEDDGYEQMRLPWATARAPKTGQEWDRAWLAFSNLSQQAVNHFPPQGDAYAFITALAAGAGANPSYSAVREIVPRWRSYSILPAAMLRSLFAESELRAQKQRHGLTQRDLMAQARTALALAANRGDTRYGDLSPVPEWARTALTEQDSPIPWSEWAKDIPEDIPEEYLEPAPQRTPTPRRRPKQASGQTWAERKDQLVQLMLGTAREELDQALQNAVTLESVPGRSVTLRAKTQEQPVLHVERAPDLSLRLEANGYLTSNIILPDPTCPPQSDTITTRGLVSRTKREIALALIDTEYGESFPGPAGARPHSSNQVSAALMETAHGSPDEDEKLSGELISAVHALLDPAVWYDAQQIIQGEQVTISRYNLAAQTRAFLPELRRTNPGAVGWAFAACHPEEPVNHPGQVISMARDFLQQNGLEPGSWRTAAGMPTITACMLYNACSPSQATLILNALGRAGAGTGNPALWDSTLWDAVQTVRHQDLRAGNPQDPHSRNALTLLTLFFREAATLPGLSPNVPPGLDARISNRRPMPQPQDEPQDEFQYELQYQLQDNRPRDQTRSTKAALAQQLQYVADYTSAQAWNGDPVRSTTWNGLKKASDRWHRQLRHTKMETLWLQIVARQEGRYRAWNSHLGEVQVGDLTLVPLRSEFDLYQEALEMQHCIIGYGEPCASGRSRIFSVRQDGARTATGEIQLTGNSWQETQTRGHRNHPAPDGLREAVVQAAELYTQAHRTAGRQDPHTSWLVPWPDPEPASSATRPDPTAGPNGRTQNPIRRCPPCPDDFPTSATSETASTPATTASTSSSRPRTAPPSETASPSRATPWTACKNTSNTPGSSTRPASTSSRPDARTAAPTSATPQARSPAP